MLENWPLAILRILQLLELDMAPRPWPNSLLWIFCCQVVGTNSISNCQANRLLDSVRFWFLSLETASTCNSFHLVLCNTTCLKHFEFAKYESAHRQSSPTFWLSGALSVLAWVLPICSIIEQLGPLFLFLFASPKTAKSRLKRHLVLFVLYCYFGCCWSVTIVNLVFTIANCPKIQPFVSPLASSLNTFRSSSDRIFMSFLESRQVFQWHKAKKIKHMSIEDLTVEKIIVTAIPQA